jgi:hypothetical protein
MLLVRLRLVSGAPAGPPNALHMRLQQPVAPGVAFRVEVLNIRHWRRHGEDEDVMTG